jgi:hypothetical protein
MTITDRRGDAVSAQDASGRRIGIRDGQGIKAPVRLATTANINLTGLQTIDGVLTVEDDRVLVRANTDARENGIWVATSGDWERATDFNGEGDARKGTRVFVTSGNTYADKDFTLTTADPVVIGTSNLTFVVYAPDIDLAFTGLSDTPASYSGQNFKLVKVNDAGTGLEFKTASSTSVLGNATGSAAAHGDIQATTNDRIFARVGDVLDWVQITIGMIPDALITFAKMATAAVATAAEFRAATASKLLSTASVWDGAAPVALTSGATPAIDFSGGLDFYLVMAHNATLQNPTNVKPGQKGCIRVSVVNTYTLAFGSNWYPLGGSLPAEAGTVMICSFWAYDADHIYFSWARGE